jgi:hypothetical protein
VGVGASEVPPLPDGCAIEAEGGGVLSEGGFLARWNVERGSTVLVRRCEESVGRRGLRSAQE